ncbi:hypothetical protein F5X96DRAFT_671128 [Biscogniauxia mediterranea]|nr:hypothetical protein F5X96DRAFT_671128 [Biscogniauxia mediterranea]
MRAYRPLRNITGLLRTHQPTLTYTRLPRQFISSSHSRKMASSAPNTSSSSSSPNPSNAPQPTSSGEEQQQQHAPLPLPAPPALDAAAAKQVYVGGEGVKLDHLGPLVVHEDGTLSRVANWGEMAEIERENTLRVLGRRNRMRLDALKEKRAAEAAGADAGEGKGSG